MHSQEDALDSLLNSYQFDNAKNHASTLEISGNTKILYKAKVFSAMKEMDSAFYYISNLDTLGLSNYQMAEYYFVLAETRNADNKEDLALPLYVNAQQLFYSLNELELANDLNFEIYSTIQSQKHYSYPKQHYLDLYETTALENDFSKQVITASLARAQQYFMTESQDSVYYFFNRAKRYAEQSNDVLINSRIPAILSVYHAEVSQHADSALYYIQKEADMLATVPSNYRLPYNLINQANAARKQGNIPKAINLLHKADSVPHSLYRKNVKILIYELLVHDYESIGNTSEALRYSKLLMQYRDRVNVSDQNANITKFQAGEKEKQNLILTNEVTRKKRQQRNLWIGSILIVAIGSLLGYLLFKNTKRKQRIAEQQREIEIQKTEKILRDQELTTIDAMIEGQEKERQRLASDLHDSVGATLSAAKLQFDHLSKNKDKLDDLDELFSKTGKLLEDAYTEVRSMAHIKNSGVLAKNGLLPAIQKLAKNASGTNKLQIDVQDFGLDERLENSLEITVFRIIQELVTNIIKHANASEASISVTQHEDSLNIIVEDDGKGFNPLKLSKADEGMGLDSIERRVEHLEGSMEVDSSEGNGTTIVIDIPL
ncbi:MAG: two-component system sensor histidine kinase DegS [Candidatus Latescibacterota bacterium]|jgi:two-component system sensor histidine kinase DegS